MGKNKPKIIGLGIPSSRLAFHPGGEKTLSLWATIMEACIERLGKDPDIDPTKADQNEYFSPIGLTSGAEVYAYCKQRRDEVNKQRAAAGQKALRKDYVPLCSTILKPNYKFMRGLSKEEQNKFLHDAVAELLKIVGEDRLIMACYHWDEQNPHVHVLWEPVVREEGKPDRFLASKLHDATYLGQINREIVPSLRAKGWNIDKSFDWMAATKEQRDERAELIATGQMPSGMSSAEYKDFMSQTVQELEQSVEELLEQRGSLTGAVLVLEAQKKSMMDEMSQAAEALLQVKQEVNAGRLEGQELQKALSKIRGQMAKALVDYQAMNTELDEIADLIRQGDNLLEPADALRIYLEKEAPDILADFDWEQRKHANDWLKEYRKKQAKNQQRQFEPDR